MITLKNLSKSFDNGKSIVLENINLNINSGSIVGITGSNGCGKSTLLRIIAGILLQDKGEILFSTEGQKYIDTRNYIKENVSLIGDANRSLYWNLTGVQNINYFCSLNNVHPSRCEEFISLFEMEDFINQEVRFYSKGMKQKLLLTLGLIKEPRVLLMDEPFNGLDNNSSQSFIEKIKKYAKDNNRIFIIVSHEAYFLNDLCDEIYLIKEQNIKRIFEQNNKTIDSKGCLIFKKSKNIKLFKEEYVFDKSNYTYVVYFYVNDLDFYKKIYSLLLENTIEIISVDK